MMNRTHPAISVPLRLAAVVSLLCLIGLCAGCRPHATAAPVAAPAGAAGAVAAPVAVAVPGVQVAPAVPAAPAAPAALAALAAPAAPAAPDAPADGEAPAVIATSSGDVARWIHRTGDDRPLPQLFAAQLAEAAGQGRSIIVMFTADWCSPCKAIKEYVHESAVVQKALAKGRMIYIDVDEWRGPAHQLIAGVNPTKLPTMVAVDRAGAQVVTFYGSELGLLSEDAVAHNLGRTLLGQAPETPAYESDAAAQSELIRKSSAAQSARVAGEPDVEAVIEESSAFAARVRLRIHNHDGPRRWYWVQTSPLPLTETPAVDRLTTHRFTEHVRATLLTMTGKPPFVAVPVAGYGGVDLKAFALQGAWKKGDKLQVWALSRLSVNGEPLQFQMKLPYHLNIEHASALQPLGSSDGAVTVQAQVHQRYEVELK